MNVQKYNGHVIELYDSIDEMPIVRFHKYNKYLLIEGGVGSDLEDVLNHIDRAAIYCKANPTMAVNELQNLRQTVYFMKEEISPKCMAFAVLVARIDGEEQNDLTDVGLQRVLDKLQEAKKGWIDWALSSVKKKIDEELSLYFPGRFEDVTSKEYIDQLKEHTILTLEKIRGADVDESLAEIEERLALLAKPKVFSGRRSVEIAYDKEFEEMCLILSQSVQSDPHTMTVLQFYNAFDYLKKQIKRKK